jgi:hypothetical protein
MILPIAETYPTTITTIDPSPVKILVPDIRIGDGTVWLLVTTVSLF